jgi:toxin ParE1/3/4
MIVEWRRAALADRDAAVAYLRTRNPRAAQQLLSALILASRSLVEFPEQGRVGAVPGTRELVTVHPYVLIYEIHPEANRVSILRLWHAAQDR